VVTGGSRAPQLVEVTPMTMNDLLHTKVIVHTARKTQD